MVQFLDPRAEVGVVQEPYTLGIDLTTAQKPKVALLANGFPDSVRFLNKVGAALQALVPQAEIVEFDKGNASVTVSEEMLAEIDGADAAIAAYGH